MGIRAFGTSLLAALAALALGGCASGSDAEDGELLTLDQAELESVLLEVDSLPGGYERRELSPVPGDQTHCKPATVFAAASAWAGFERPPSGRRYVSQGLSAYTRDEAPEAFRYMLEGRDECDEIPGEVVDDLGDEAMSFEWLYAEAVPMREIVWRRENVLAGLATSARLDLEELAREADRRLEEALATGGEVSNEVVGPPPREPFEFEEFRDFERFALYWLGEESGEYPLTEVLGSPEATNVTFIYGDCYITPQQDYGCGPPLSIQIWPACERYLEALQGIITEEGAATSGLAPEEQSPVQEIRGVPAASFGQLEIYTGDVTVVIFGEAAEEVAEALRSVDGEIEVGEDLPPPVDGHLEGRAPCPD
jgi:hypothetical protein